MDIYHKIQSIYKRDEKTHKFIEGDFSLPIFEYLFRNVWEAEEKFDGTCTRVKWDTEKLRFDGKTDNAQMPTKLLHKLEDIFSERVFKELYPETSMCLYGEGFGCFYCDSPVSLADGSKMRIGEIVNQRKNIDVLSYNFNTNRHEAKKVIGFSKINDDKGDWITLYVARKWRGGKSSRLILTKNHIVFVKRGAFILEIPAGELITGDKLLTPINKVPYFQKQLILGSLLGDGSLDDSMFYCTHSEKHLAYFEFKINLLNSLVSSVRDIISGYGSKEKRLYTKVIQEMKDIKGLIYDEYGKKIVTEKYLNLLHPFALAVWYMDDGSLESHRGKYTCKLCTDGFTEQEVRLLVAYFNRRGYECCTKRSKNHFRVAFSPDGTEAFLSSIAPFMVKHFNYKLMPFLREIPKIWDKNILYENVNTSLVETLIVKIEKDNPYSEKWKRYRYDIEVEDNHNYFVNNILVHNSGIQKGGKYIPDGVDFILFDVKVGQWWLERDNVTDIANKLSIKRTPVIADCALEEAVVMIKSGVKSTYGDFLSEGLVLRPKVGIFCRNGNRIITKIKHKDF